MFFFYVKDFYEKLLTENEIREIFLDNMKNLEFYFGPIVVSSSPDQVEKVAKYLRNLFKNDKNDLRGVLSHRDRYGRTIFYRSYHHENTSIFVELLKQTFSEDQEEEFKKFLNELQRIDLINAIVKHISYEPPGFNRLKITCKL
jgi:hypothetical protein